MKIKKVTFMTHRNSAIIVINCLLLALVLQELASCSTMKLNSFPQADTLLFLSAKKQNGISMVAQPILDIKKSKEYFGIDLINNEIFAVHLTIQNKNLEQSHIISADSAKITHSGFMEVTNDPSKRSQQGGEIAGYLGAVLMSPLFLAVATQELSDSSIIKENFERKKFRTTTIEPNETVSGFIYFNWNKVKLIDTPQLCLLIVNPIEDTSIPYCLDVIIKR